MKNYSSELNETEVNMMLDTMLMLKEKLPIKEILCTKMGVIYFTTDVYEYSVKKHDDNNLTYIRESDFDDELTEYERVGSIDTIIADVLDDLECWNK